jgi:hypothetical protein
MLYGNWLDDVEINVYNPAVRQAQTLQTVHLGELDGFPFRGKISFIPGYKYQATNY